MISTAYKFMCMNRLRLRFAAALIPQLLGNSIPGQWGGHTTREPLMQTQTVVRAEFELAIDGIKFYVIYI